MKSMIENLKRILNHDVFELPYNQVDSGDFYSFISDKLDSYKEHLKTSKIDEVTKSLDWSESGFKDITVRVEQLTEKITASLGQYLNGKVLKSTELFYEGLNQIYFYNSSLNVATVRELQTGQEFYRIRRAEEQPFSREEMFHIPFQKRHLVSTQRYSIPGLPSLYLGDTIFICWTELDKPKIREFYSTKLTNLKAQKVIEILRKADMINSLDGITDEWKLTILLRYLVTFPLIAACSVRTKHPKGTFKPEYIIPQMLLQYVTEHVDIDGIKYFSTKINYKQLKDFTTYNYVFPPKKSKNNAFCDKLTETFHLTEVTSLELEEIKYNKKYQTGMLMGGETSDKRKLEITSGETTYYSQTVFKRLESALNLLSCSKLN